MKQLHFPHLVTLFSEHGGMKDAIKVRSRYWIISIWHLVKSIIKKCFLCQRFESKTYRYLPSASLRPYNLQLSLPFETTGVDYLGPVLVKPIFSDTDSNYFYKSQTVLFTCAVTRAFHPEVVPNLTMPSFICALKQFIWRRGIPNLEISDNGTGFKNEEFRLSEELTRMKGGGEEGGWRGEGEHFLNEVFQSYYDLFQVAWLVQNWWYLHKSE